MEIQIKKHKNQLELNYIFITYLLFEHLILVNKEHTL